MPKTKVDLVQKLRTWKGHALTHVVLNEAADEIEMLRNALALAVGEMSSSGEYSYLSPDQLMQHFLEEARRG